MTQEQYRKYRERLTQEGYPFVESTTIFPTEDDFRKLEDRIGKIPWSLVKMD